VRADLTAALCSPKDSPFGLKVDPTKVELDLSGDPAITAPPFVVELPTLTVTPPNVTVTWPKLHANVNLTFNPFPPGFSGDLSVDPGTLDITVTPLTIDLGTLRVHAVPQGGNDLPIQLGIDFDQTSVIAAFDGLHANVEGCLTLNGGEAPPPVQPPPPTVSRVAVDHEGRVATKLVIFGQGFGANQGQGFVEAVDNNLAHTKASSYPQGTWADQHVVALFQPALQPGPYVAIVHNDAGGTSAPAAFTV
jgi:hypothetical protein